jgi:hypothetical protein
MRRPSHFNWATMPPTLHSNQEQAMPKFTIETTYRLPIFRQRCYEAETLEAACRLAIEDEDWSDQKEDCETSGETYVTGVWAGTFRLTASQRSQSPHI